VKFIISDAQVAWGPVKGVCVNISMVLLCCFCFCNVT